MGVARGFTSKETLLGCLVLLVAGGVLGGIGFLMVRRQAGDADASRMRQLYVALTMYEEENGGQPAPDLTFAYPYVPDTGAYLSDRDPFAKAAGPFPIDGSLPAGKPVSKFRISFGYLWAHRKPKDPAWDWAKLSRKDRLGFIADEWVGSVTPGSGFQARVSGPVLRVNRDGSLFTTPSREETGLGDVGEVFGKVGG